MRWLLCALLVLASCCGGVSQAEVGTGAVSVDLFSELNALLERQQANFVESLKWEQFLAQKQADRDALFPKIVAAENLLAQLKGNPNSDPAAVQAAAASVQSLRDAINTIQGQMNTVRDAIAALKAEMETIVQRIAVIRALIGNVR